MDEETPSRWDQVGTTLSNIAPICTQHDKDGIDIHFLNKGDSWRFKHLTKYARPFVLTLLKAANHAPLISAKAVNKIFEKNKPHGMTPTGQRLNEILMPYVAKCEKAYKKKHKPPKSVNMIVITDGAPNDFEEKYYVANVLEAIGKRLNEIDADKNQLGVMFCQVGNVEVRNFPLPNHFHQSARIPC